jgi:hypothetical protein
VRDAARRLVRKPPVGRRTLRPLPRYEHNNPPAAQQTLLRRRPPKHSCWSRRCGLYLDYLDDFYLKLHVRHYLFRIREVVCWRRFLTSALDPRGESFQKKTWAAKNLSVLFFRPPWLTDLDTTERTQLFHLPIFTNCFKYVHHILNKLNDYIFCWLKPGYSVDVNSITDPFCYNSLPFWRLIVACYLGLKYRDALRGVAMTGCKFRYRLIRFIYVFDVMV